MNRYFAFAINTRTIEGYTVAAAGICDKGKKRESIKQISRIEEFKCDNVNGPLDVDYKLAAFLKSISPLYIHAIGASIKIDGMTEIGGGVIGSPHKEICSSADCIEHITDDLILYSRPEGPGFIIQGDEETAKSISAQLNCTDKLENNMPLEVLNCMVKSSVKTGIIVADGSGTESCGCVIAYNNGKASIKMLR